MKKSECLVLEVLESLIRLQNIDRDIVFFKNGEVPSP